MTMWFLYELYVIVLMHTFHKCWTFSPMHCSSLFSLTDLLAFKLAFTICKSSVAMARTKFYTNSDFKMLIIRKILVSERNKNFIL